MLAAPLLAGNDLRNMSPETIAILTNREVIAVDQDSIGLQGRRARVDGAIEVWTRVLANGAFAVALFNRGQMPAHIAVGWKELGLKDPRRVRDLWSQRDAERVGAEYAVDVEPHGAVLVRLDQ